MNDTILSTGEVAELLTRCGRDITEPQLAHAIRKRRLASPPVSAGRRLWSLEDVLRAAECFGVPAETVLRDLRAEAR